MNPLPPVGLVGVGNMGAPMAERLLDAGATVVVRDVRPQAEAPLVARGARRADSPAALAQAVDVIALVVVDAVQIDTVLFDGPAAAAPHLEPRHCVCLHSTIAPDDTRRIAQRLQALGVAVVDAPISGGPARARTGTLSMMAAADPVALDRARPVLRHWANRLFEVGTTPGQGAAMKLVNNLLAGANLAAAAEAFGLGRRAGLDPRTMLDVIGASSGQSWIVDDRFPRLLGGDAVPRAQLHILAKDLRLAMQMARAVGARSPLGAAAEAAFAAALAAGLGDVDDSALAQLYDPGRDAA